MHSLLDAVLSVGRELDLEQVLRRIIEAAVALTDSEYGALGVIGDHHELDQFVHVGLDPEQAARIGELPSGQGILGELIHRPEPLRLRNLTEHPASHGFPPNHPPMHSFLGVPIRVREVVFGNIYLSEKRGGAEFDEEDEAVLGTLAVAAGVAIDNARLYHESRRRTRWLEALAGINRSLLSGSPPDEVLRLIARGAMEVADADSACVLMPAEDTDRLRITVAEGQPAERLLGSTLPGDESLAVVAARTGEPVVAGDLRAEPRARLSPGVEEDHGPAVAVPMPTREESGGALRLTRLAGRPRFDDTEVGLLSNFAAQAALALELGRHRAEAEQLALLHDRDRIARDLHDLAIQRLFATGMTLQSAAPLIEHPAAAERVGRAVDDLDETIKIIRSTIFALRTAEQGGGDPASLRRRLARAVGEVGGHLGFTPSLRVEGAVDARVPADVAEELLAVLAEALSNTLRHARARRVDVALSVRDRIVLTVTDDGVGLGDNEPRGGLLNMRSRAELLGGVLRLEPGTAEGGGTRIHWEVPFPAQGE
ncbi:GAF domain-containing sensor histidine kinase [Streptomyces alkaliphilus]|uniref:GAF domain-containing protein n=1 Tax=Streptomyces alkaliphilus TaxID=1472722 RepID=A0A7W3TAK5_9ACTN|nr:GAF domain-containing sensor histidine kinase [Streptomyces alkaliphilus]MBB0243318.1 GAF domain-containing protein [Streptomyces alkaliphilus]MQS08552.1 GAF domain-containing protein [Streptomyces alkaliphilus]